MGLEQDVEVSERLQPITVSGSYEGKYRSVVQVRDLPALYFDEPADLGGSNAGPTPLETILSALVSCSGMISYILQREQGFKVEGMRYDARGVIDVRRAVMRTTGKKYSEIEPVAKHFHAVRVEMRVKTPEPDDRLKHFGAEVERLCPVINLLRDAGVALEIAWLRD